MITLEFKCETCGNKYIVATEEEVEVLGCPLCLTPITIQDDLDETEN